MQFSIQFAAVLCLAPFVASERVFRILLNNGANQTGLYCSEADIEKIAPIVQNENLGNIRYLRKSTPPDRAIDSVSEAKGYDSKRDLATYYPPECKNLCKGYTKGYTCFASKCSGYIVRRDLAGKEKEDRKLQESWCTSVTNSVNAQLTELVTSNQVSDSCKLLLKAPRKPECFNDIVFGVVESFTAWDGDRDVALKTDARNGFDVCPKTAINFEVVVNPCVKFVTMILKGPNGYYKEQYEGAVPYTVFGNTGSDLVGKQLPPGKYNLTAFPDGFQHKSKSLLFNVNASNC